jgi:hypothetical protein
MLEKEEKVEGGGRSSDHFKGEWQKQGKEEGIRGRCPHVGGRRKERGGATVGGWRHVVALRQGMPGLLIGGPKATVTVGVVKMV